MGTTTDNLVTPSVLPETEPALIVAFGATNNRRRPLPKTSTLIGRNRCCDIRVESPEISGLHCLISRHEQGLTLRDCDSKSGVLVNGQVARECELKDGDQIQVGPFSFVVSIPPASVGPLASSSGEARRVEEELERKVEQEKCLQNHIASVEAERDRIALQLQDIRAELHRSTLKAQDLDVAYSEIDRLKREINDRELLGAELGQTLCSLDEYRRAAETRNGRLADELESLRATIVDRDAISIPSETITPAPHEELTRLAEESRRWQNLVTELTQENQSLRATLAESTRRQSENASPAEMLELRGQAQEAQANAQRLQAEGDQLRAEVSELRIELVRLQGELESHRLSDEESGLATGAEPASLELRAELERLASDCNEFRSQVEQLRRENESLQTLAKDHQSRAEWLETELEAVNSQTHRSKAEMEALRYATDVAVKESDGLREHSRQLESELSTLRTEHLSLTQTQAMDLGGSKRKIESLEAELKGVRQDLENREKQLIAAQQEKAQLKSELDSSGTSLVGDLAQARAYIADLDRELATLRSQGSASEELMLEMDALRQQLAGVEREASELAAENRRLQQELVRRPDPSFAEDLAGEGSAGVSARPHEELERLQANWQASEEARFELTRRLEAEHEQAEQRLLAMRQQLEAERSQMKQLVMQAAAEHDRTRAEMEALRQQVGSGGMIQSSDEAIQQELNYLRTRLQEFESAFPGDGSAGTSPDLAQYEEQLEQYRADLEQAQAELSQREQELETERQNVHEKLRQAELDISRERATFAREKAELDRLRREFLAEVEHTERESSARARLAPLDRLASEVKGRVKEAANVPQQPSLSDRLRSFMKRSPDGPTKSDG